MAGDHGVSCSELGVAWLMRALGWGVLGMASLIERLVLDDLLDGDCIFMSDLANEKIGCTFAGKKGRPTTRPTYPVRLKMPHLHRDHCLSCIRSCWNPYK